MTPFQYQGDELELFAAAVNWKHYIAAKIRPWLGPTVLEVGAGIGSNLQYLAVGVNDRWLALEPDRAMAEVIQRKILDHVLPQSCHVMVGTIAQILRQELFDTVLYIDVLEHIADDSQELNNASQHLAPGGHLVVLVPAHPFLFSPFDQAIGHYRRYSLKKLKRLTPTGCIVVSYAILDSVGFFASLVNLLLLRSDQPSRRQIAFWDRYLVPLSRLADRLTGYHFGKTALMIWRRTLDLGRDK